VTAMTPLLGRRLRTAACTAALLLLSTVLPAQALASAPVRTGRGTPVFAERLFTLEDPQQIGEVLEAVGFSTTTVRHGVDAYRLVYRTVDAHGRPTTASGLVALPHGRRGLLTPVVYTHGSELTAADAPSTDPRGFTAAGPLSYAAAGYAALAPDYLGLGTGPGDHPWLDVPSETTATLDMLRAARRLLPTLGRRITPELLAAGFSQGAGAVLGLARALQQRPSWFRLRAVAAVSGAYDLRHAQIPAMLSGELDAKTNVVNIGYAYPAFDRTYDVYDDPADVFAPQYADAVEELTDGSHTWQELAAATPGTLDDLLTDHGMELLRHPEGAMATALAAADAACRNWVPRVPVRLYYTAGDEQAVNANTVRCRDSFAQQGAAVPTVDVRARPLNGSLHFGSNVAATDRVLDWFEAVSPAGRRTGETAQVTQSSAGVSCRPISCARPTALNRSWKPTTAGDASGGTSSFSSPTA
jgi:hypothetical protein